MAGMMKAYDPPITTGNRVPNQVCNKVLIPATNNRVFIISAFSTYHIYKHCLVGEKMKEKKGGEKLKSFLGKYSYISATHERNEYSGECNSSSKHHQVVLKSQKYDFGCNHFVQNLNQLPFSFKLNFNGFMWTINNVNKITIWVKGETKKNRERITGENRSPLLGIQENKKPIVSGKRLRCLASTKLLHNTLIDFEEF